MALISTLRNKMGKIVVGAIMLTMLSFILTDLIGNSSLLGGGQDPDIAEISGESISNERFQQKLQMVSNNFGIITGRNASGNEMEGIRNGAWNALILEAAYHPQFDELGIEVTNAEIRDMVRGDNISLQIRQNFADPQTGEFSVDNVITFLEGLKSATPLQQQGWILFESSLVENRRVVKYESLLTRTTYVTKYETKDEYISQNASATFEYVYVPFLSVSDSSVDVEESDLERYLNARKKEYKREGSRSADYVIFNIAPSSSDSLFTKEEIEDIRVELIASANDSVFVNVNSDDPYSFMTYTEPELPAELKLDDKAREVGYVSVPLVTNGAYEFYKLSRKDEITTDSVLYRVAKIRKNFFASDETVNEVYRKADLFAASVDNIDEFKKEAQAQNLLVLNAGKVSKNDRRFGFVQNARALVSWLYNADGKGTVSDVKEIDNQYVIAVMTGEQEPGVANLDDVRNEIMSKVRNDKKSVGIIEKLNAIGGNDLKEIASSYGEDAKTGTADVQLALNSATGIGYAPEAIGIGFALNEEENTRAFAVQDGVVMIKLLAKTMPEDQADYGSFKSQIIGRRVGSTSIIADFPFTYFRVPMSRNIDETIKEFSDIEDMRHKFF